MKPDTPDPNNSEVLGPLEDDITASLVTEADRLFPHRYVAVRKVIAPDVAAAVRRFHRAEDGFARLMARVDGDDLASLGSADSHLFDLAASSLGDQLRRDAYFSINAFWREGSHRTRDLRYLNSAYVDMDCFHGPDGLTPSKAINLVDEAQFRRVIPPASLIVNSGRGIWCFWHLLDEHTKQPPRAYSDSTVPLYRAINAELQKRLNEFAPALRVDLGASDPSRLCRIVGSVNSRASGDDRTVRFWVQADQFGLGFVYTLKGLATLIAAKPRYPRMPTKTGVRVPSRRAGWVMRWSRPLADLLKLDHLRGGFRRGHRAKAAFVYAYLQRKLRRDDAAIREGLARLAARCTPKMSPGMVEDALKGSRSATIDTMAHMRNDTIAKWLEVTPSEAEKLVVLRAPGQAIPKVESARARAASARRDALGKLIGAADAQRRPSVRALQRSLREMGIEAGLATISHDLKLL